jgi:glycosyltransferase involved in cell wall biosynthesis
VSAPGEILADPLDSAGAYRFFVAYEAGSDHSPTEELRYLQLKCLHEPTPWRWLNDVGRRFVDQGRRSSAFLCFIHSLWLNSRQPEIFRLCMSLESAMSPPRLTEGSPEGSGVSVIIPTYNRGAGIRESLRSVLQQTWQDFEIIVVNDGGDDAVEPILRDLDDPRIRYHKLERNEGKSAARNAGIRLARGRYIAYLDDDDVYLPEHLASLVRALAEGGHQVAYSSTRGVLGRWEDGSFVREANIFVWNDAFDRDRLLVRLSITTCSLMMAREVLSTAGLFIPDLHISQDWELWLRCALAHPFRHVEAVTCEYRVSSQNSTIADRAGAYLFGSLVTQYHMFHCGLLAYAKYFLAAGDLDEARRRYELILARAPGYFRHPRQLEDIAGLARRLGDRRSVRALTRECFERWPRECLLSNVRRRSSFSRWEVLSLLPSRILRTARRHVRRRIGVVA